MNLKSILKSSLLIGTLALFSIAISSCDDDDGNGTSDPDIQENEASGKLTGAVEAQVRPDDDIEVEMEQEDDNNDNQITTLKVSWKDSSDNKVEVEVTSSGNTIGTGTFDILSSLTNAPDQFSSVSVTYNGTSWNASGESGNVTITTNNKKRVAGTINDVKLDNPDPSDEAQVTINAEFNALKNGGNNNNDDGPNIVNLTGDEEADIKARNQPQYQLGGSAMNINWQGENNITNTVSIGIVGLGKTETATVDAFNNADVQDPSNVPDQFVNLSVTYEGTDYKTVDGSGNVEVTTNTESRIEGSINSIKLEGDSKTITAKGSFAVDK